jgi:hypothetical protein
MLQFYVCFCIFLTLMWYVAFLCLTPCPSYTTLSHAGLLEVHVPYLGSIGYFPAWGPVLPDDRPSERLLLMGGSVCAAYLAWFRTVSMHTPPPERCWLITGGPAEGGQS